MQIKKYILIVLFIFSTFLLIGCKKDDEAQLIVTGDYKTSYYLDQSFDPEGMIVTYKKGNTEEIIEDYEISGFDSSSVGQSTVVITYLDVSTTISVQILFGVQTSTQVKIYDMPDILESSERYEILVEESPLFVYETLVNHARSFHMGQFNR